MASLSFSPSTITRNCISRYRFAGALSSQIPGRIIRYPLGNTHYKTARMRCTNLYPWENSPSDSSVGEGASIIAGSSVIQSIKSQDTDELPILDNGENVVEMKCQPVLEHQPLKWPMWLLGPSLLLVTGMVPTLWLPLPSVFLGANIAGVLALVGLDLIFNMGATLFLLMADACARPKSMSRSLNCQVPLPYMIWNMAACMVGFIVPLVMIAASCRGFLQPHLPFISSAVLLGPYLLLLSTQMLTEMLTWHWKSPVWLVTPVVYEAYRVLQLMRGLRLGAEIGAPPWAVDGVRCLVSWWILILCVQLMRIAWFAGYAVQTQKQT